MELVFKYELTSIGENEIEIPMFASILCVKVQYGVITLWAKVDPGMDKEKRMFEVFATGEIMKKSNEYNYVDTVILKDGSLVYHIFEK